MSIKYYPKKYNWTQISAETTGLKIKELGIAENVIFIIFDDYYYLKEPEKCKKIKNLLEQHKKKITMLYHNSRAKLK